MCYILFLKIIDFFAVCVAEKLTGCGFNEISYTLNKVVATTIVVKPQLIKH